MADPSDNPFRRLIGEIHRMPLSDFPLCLPLLSYSREAQRKYYLQCPSLRWTSGIPLWSSGYYVWADRPLRDRA